METDVFFILMQNLQELVKYKEIYVSIVDSQVICDKKTKYTYHYVTAKKINAPEQIAFKDKYATFEEYMKDYHGYEKRDPDTNKYGYWYNPKAKWDWYELGGRWNGFFKLKEGFIGKVQEKKWFRSESSWKHANQSRIKNIDFESMKDEAGKEAEEKYDNLLKLLEMNELPKIIPWSDFIDEKGKYAKMNIEQKREIYQAQPILVKINLKTQEKELNEDDRNFLSWLTYEEFMVGREAYVKSYKEKHIAPFAILKDGKWYEKGEMGWWGMIRNEKDKNKWYEEFDKLIKELDPDTLLSVYDCHI